MIISTSNAQIKELAKLQKKSRLRDEKGIFLVEGPRMTEEIPAERIEKVYASESFAKKNKEFLERLQAPVELLTDTVFAYVSDTKTPQGILAIVKRLNYTMNDLMQVKNQKAPHLVVLDNLQDPGNLGTIFRTAEAAGVTGILLSKDCVDVYNPKVIRSTMGLYSVCRSSMWKIFRRRSKSCRRRVLKLTQHICVEKMHTTRKIIQLVVHF